MSKSNHNLSLGMYSFKIKRKNTSNANPISINEFLSEAYPNDENKFNAFSNDIINLIDTKTFKNTKNTHGGKLGKMRPNTNERFLDLLIDGGLTGIKQFLIDENGNKETITKDKVVGLIFYGRFWMPAGGDTGFIFIQKYGGSNLKPLFEELIFQVVTNKGFSIVGNRSGVRPTTTKSAQRR